MSAYDDAVAYLDVEVHPRCDYDIYSDMRDIVDEMEAESEKLRIERDEWHLEQVHAFSNWRDAYKYGKELEAKNAKLKALVRDMWWTMVKAAWDDEQPSLTEIRERMDEAGVEPY